MPDCTGPSSPATAAAQWLQRLLTAEDSVDMEGLEQWLAESDEHARLFAEVSRARDIAQAVAGEPGLRALREDALARVAWASRRRRRVRALASSIAAILVGIALWQVAPIDLTSQPTRLATVTADAMVHETRVGQHRRLTLSDGSVIDLDTDSRLRILFTDDERRLILDRGQALFEVAYDAARRFVVVAGGQAITAYGTRFGVRLERDAMSVALVEGHVSVSSAGDMTAQVIDLEPRQQLRMAGGQATVSQIASVERLLGWRDGRVYFDNASVADAVTEMNRYRVSKIVLAQPDLGRLRLSGAFNAGSDSFVQALEAFFALQVTEHTTEHTLLARRGGAQ